MAGDKNMKLEGALQLEYAIESFRKAKWRLYI